MENFVNATFNSEVNIRQTIGEKALTKTICIPSVNTETMDIIVDMNEQFEIKKLRKSEFIKFIQIKNSLLRIKTLEQEDPIQNRQDIISHLECLLELTKLQK